MMPRLLMTSSATVMALLGLSCLFVPDGILRLLVPVVTPAGTVLVQLVGALYLGFAMLNWMGRGNLIGGIYGRPVTVANLLHFFIAAVSLLKAVRQGPEAAMLWPLALLSTIYAIGFGVVAFGRAPVAREPT